MKAVKINLAGRERHLCFTVEAMFQIEERFGGAQELTDTMEANSRIGFEAVCGAAAILAEQGELCRRSMGYEPEPLCSAEDIAVTIVPTDLARLKLAVVSAITLGYGREIRPENDEVDLGLSELNEQKKQVDPGPLHPDRGPVRPHPAGDAAVYPG